MTINQESLLPCIEIEPSGPAQQSVIWLHGLGADGNDFVSIIPELHLSPALNVRFIFPHAPIMPVTINAGYEMRAWFDIYGVAITAKIDETGIAQSARRVEALIEREESRGIATNNIMLAGFSQGAVMALTTGLGFSRPLAGIIALSGYLPLADQVLQHASKANRNIPIFIAHGKEDPIVAYSHGKATYLALKKANYPVAWHSYPMQHSLCGDEIRDISEWMRKVF